MFYVPFPLYCTSTVLLILQQFLLTNFRPDWPNKGQRDKDIYSRVGLSRCNGGKTEVTMAQAEKPPHKRGSLNIIAYPGHRVDLAM